MTLTYNEAQIKARHDARVAQLREAFGEMTQVPFHLLAKLHDLNAQDWRVFVAERDSKKHSETIVPALMDIEAVNRANNAHTGVISGPQSPNRAATPGVGAPLKASFFSGDPLDHAYAALVGTEPGLEGRIDARRSLVGLPDAETIRDSKSRKQ